MHEKSETIEKRKQIALSKGLEYLGRLTHSETIERERLCDYGTYKRLECGHEQVLNHKNVSRLKTLYCKKCTDEGHIKLAESFGMTFIGFSRPTRGGTLYIDVTMPCGHFKSIQTGNLANGSFSCHLCFLESLSQICKSNGMRYVGPLGNNLHSVEIPCGCVVTKHISNLASGHWSCPEHKSSARYHSGFIYLFQIDYSGKSWLKLGYSSNLHLRAKAYSDLPLGVTLKHSVYYDDGRVAEKIEKNLHRQLRSNRIDPAEMKEYMFNGFTECYSIDHVDLILDMMKGLNEK